MDKPDLSAIEPSLRASLRRKRSDVVAELIRNHIFHAGLHPGDRLPQESELIEKFGCSRSTIREALKSLEVQGLVQNTTGPGGGARVALVSINRIIGLLSNYFYFQSISSAQIYQIRRLIEPELAFSVVSHLKKAHFEALEKAIAVQEEPPPRGTSDWDHHRHAEIDFHDILIEACPNPLLGLVCRFVNEAIRHLIGRHGEQKFSAAFTVENIDFHKRLLSAFRSGNAARARRVMLDHMLRAEAVVVPRSNRRTDQPVFTEPLRLD